MFCLGYTCISITSVVTRDVQAPARPLLMRYALVHCPNKGRKFFIKELIEEDSRSRWGVETRNGGKKKSI